ncbi:MAG: glycosyltransferase family 4 protein [Candidatus Aenigmarchaeota archaeon]|nr:glycosyltransferase family 4 protein [Candidatus Aenigmarchaeota archaeon]
MIKICIDARLISGEAGGLEQVVIGLAQGFSRLIDGNEKYYFLTYPESQKWLKNYVHGPCEIISSPNKYSVVHWKSRIRNRYPVVRRLWHSINSAHCAIAGSKVIKIPRSNGLIEKHGIDLMHFAFQRAFLTDVPSIYHPHDLQHIHLPGFFNKWRYLNREVKYKKFCEQAKKVIVASTWTKQDVVNHYGIPHQKVQVIPLAPSTEGYPIVTEDDLCNLKKKYALQTDFAFYPAQTWEHKNHITLIEAMAALRDEYDIKIPLVFSGHRDEFYYRIQECIRKYKMDDQVKFLGFVSPLELQALYKLCRCVVIPTKFEAASFPLWEAFYAGAPVACSNVTSLPAQAGNSALIFDPYDKQNIANTLKTLWIGEKLREKLAVRGKQNVSRFTWERSCRHFRAYYRKILGVELSKEDRNLINAKPIL